jgi:hypothetical protein
MNKKVLLLFTLLSLNAVSGEFTLKNRKTKSRLIISNVCSSEYDYYEEDESLCSNQTEVKIIDKAGGEEVLIDSSSNIPTKDVVALVQIGLCGKRCGYKEFEKRPFYITKSILEDMGGGAYDYTLLLPFSVVVETVLLPYQLAKNIHQLSPGNIKGRKLKRSLLKTAKNKRAKIRNKKFKRVLALLNSVQG